MLFNKIMWLMVRIIFGDNLEGDLLENFSLYLEMKLNEWFRFLTIPII
jgi:hypothetical protein